MQIVKIFSGEDGNSHFTTIDILQTSVVTSGNLTSLFSQPLKCKTMMLVEFDETYFLDFHPCWPDPQQYVVMMEGAVEVTVKDGSSLVFKMGDLFLAVDSTGTGHMTRGLTKGKLLMITPGDE